jgi:hypothetical protein
LFFTVNIRLEIGQIVPYLLLIFQNQTNSLSFSASFVIISEPNEWNLNSVFWMNMVKCDVDWEIMRNYK